jgi:biotin carboxylase
MSALENARSRRERIVTQWEARRILASLDIPVVRESLVFTREEARAAAKRMGYPVALRRWSPRGDARGGIRLDLADEASLIAAFDSVAPGRADSGVGALVQEMLQGERPLRAAFLLDSREGACVAVGVGGIYRRLVNDEVRRPAPLSGGEAREMIGALRAAPLLGRYRNLQPLALDSLESLLERLGRVGTSFPELQEIHLERILAREGRPVCVDARIYFT